MLVACVAFVLPLSPRAPAQGAARRPARSLYFAAIGLGFLLLEIVLIQRFVLFLGFPTYALSVVLFALLVFTGVGSALSRSARPRAPRHAESRRSARSRADRASAPRRCSRCCAR